MSRQVGPILDQGLLELGIYVQGMHKIWMCYLIYVRLPINAQRLDTAPGQLVFLNKLTNLALCEACSAAASGRFSKSVAGL